MTDTDAAQAAQQARPAPDDQPGGAASAMSVATQETGPFGTGKCKHCGTFFPKNKKKHYHCSDTCRYAEYDKRNPRLSKVPKRKRRTNQQNRALHLFCKNTATVLNDAGYSVAKTLRHDVEIPWNATLVKELLWRVVQEAMTGKHSTTELNTVEPSEIYEVVNRFLSELGVHVEWPSEETMSETDNSGQVSSSLAESTT